MSIATISLTISSISLLPCLGFSLSTVGSSRIASKRGIHPLAATSDTNSLVESYGNSEEILDVLICGAGPGGLLLASELAKQSSNLKIGVTDPALEKSWPNNYGVWMDEAECFGYEDCLDYVWKEVGIVFDETTPELCLNRPYGRVDRKKMKSRLMKECQESGVVFCSAKAASVQHFNNKPSSVKLSGKNVNSTIQALLVTDATGFSRAFVEFDTKFDPGYQNTYGARFKVKDLGPYTKERMILMDYSEMHLCDDPAMVRSNDRFPSFVYAMPLADDEIFLEETVLVSRPACPSKDLEARLYKRIQALGIEPIKVLEDERASIPMGGVDPVVPQRTLGFGATSSFVHPASGYMVARAMEISPRVAQALIPPLESLRKRMDTKDTSIDFQTELDKISEAGWGAVWPADERRQRDFMHFGFELLCKLNPQELRDFFTGFFRLPDGLWEHFLSWRLSGIGHIYMGLYVWAKCIPKRFMLPMLINSIPFIGNRLVVPFISRKGAPFLDSVYWDAPSDGASTKWEPEEYYKYLEELTEREYEGEAFLKTSTSEEKTLV